MSCPTTLTLSIPSERASACTRTAALQRRGGASRTRHSSEGDQDRASRETPRAWSCRVPCTREAGSRFSCKSTSGSGWVYLRRTPSDLALHSPSRLPDDSYASATLKDRARSDSGSRSLLVVHDHGPEAHFAFGNSVVSSIHFGQWVRLCDDLHLSLRDVVQRFVQVFAPVLLRADDLDAAEDQIRRRHGQRLRLEAHQHEAPVRAQPLHRIGHRVVGIAGAEDDINATRGG